jgi:hypothetical protein
MSEKFTPGPWRVVNGDQIRSAIHQIARAWMMRGGEGKANARLIAAAPDLYEALSAFISWWDADDKGPQYSSPDKREGPDGENEWRAWWNGQLELASLSNSLGIAALKKARGES